MCNLISQAEAMFKSGLSVLLELEEKTLNLTVKQHLFRNTEEKKAPSKE